MTPIRFIIPAAGSASRFNGTLKELLPISELDCGLTYAVRLAHRIGHCEPLVITTKDKFTNHYKAVSSLGLQCEFAEKDDPEKGDMWGSVLFGLDWDDEETAGGIILPDAVAELGSGVEMSKGITFGCFLTNESRRFSCLDLLDTSRPAIRTKQFGMQSLAWGMVSWDQESVTLLKQTTSHYDRAFEVVMQERGFGLFLLKSYHDLGSFEHYRDYLNAHRNSGHLA